MSDSPQPRRRDRVAKYLFGASVLLLVLLYGMAAQEYGLFPSGIVKNAREGYDALRMRMLEYEDLSEVGADRIPALYRRQDEPGAHGGDPREGRRRRRRTFENNLAWFYFRTDEPASEPIRRPDRWQPGLSLIVRFAEGLRLAAEIVTMDGEVVHSWDVDWFTRWPDANHVPEEIIPRSRPGVIIHGAAVLPDGDLVFNYTNLGMIRLDMNGEVVWRLPFRTDHTVHVTADGHIWACGARRRGPNDPRFPHRRDVFDEYTILEISPDGDVLQEWSVAEILEENGRGGLMDFVRHVNIPPQNVLDDRLHLNDAEPFPRGMEEGFFDREDVLVSLRNVNTVFVFNRRTRKIKYMAIGMTMMQHDADFIDGNRFSVFDNRALPEQSRIVVITAPDDRVDVVYEGTETHPFFSEAMGKHQWLANGNLLVTEALSGRAFEVDTTGEIVWEYFNWVDEGVLGVVAEAQRLPPEYRRLFLPQ